jgi:hypothetical protein
VVAAQQNSIWKNVEPPQFLGSGTLCRRKEGSRRPHHLLRVLPWPARPGGVGPSWLVSVSSSGSVSLLVKYEFCNIFWEFSWKLDLCTKTRHQSNSAENSVSPC